ncbi:hypothetical protein OC844_001800 [Tilletia horrida]|nr:hypothetical protein OC844_001800 [Tilletia horrida]
MLHILAPYILADLGLGALKLVFAAIQAGLVFTRLPSASSAAAPGPDAGPQPNQATAVVIPAIYAACAIAQIVLALVWGWIHFVELRKGELSVGAWRSAQVLFWAVVGVTGLMLVAGVVTIGYNYSDQNHWFTNGSRAFNTPFTITFIIFAGISIVHLFVLLLYKKRVLSQGPRPKGRIGNDYERVGAEFSHSIRRAQRVQDSAGGEHDDAEHLPEMTERLPVAGAEAGGNAPSSPRHTRFQTPSFSSSSGTPLAAHSQQASGHSGLRRQFSSSGYADYEDEEGDAEDHAAFYGRHNRYSSGGMSGMLQPPLAHAQQPTFGSGAAGASDGAEPVGFPSPLHSAAPSHSHPAGPRQPYGFHSQQASVVSSHSATAPVPTSPIRPAAGAGIIAHGHDSSFAAGTHADTMHQPVMPNYTGTTALPAYSERGFNGSYAVYQPGQI